jgi:hypothetical protein
MSIIQQKKTSGTLKGWWPFRNGTVDDDSGNGNDGTFSGNPYFSRDGLFFDGVNDKITIGNVSELNFGTGDFTIVATIRTYADAAGDIYCKRDGSSNTPGVFCSVSGSGKAFMEIDDGAGNELQLTSDVSIDDNNLHIVVWTFDKSGNASVYVDGVADAQTANISSVGNIDNAIVALIGQNSGVGNRDYKGFIGDVLAFSELLTATEVSELTAELQKQTYPFKPSSKTIANKLQKFDTLTSQWIMKPLGGTIVDETGAGNDATIIGNPTFVNTIIGPGAHLIDATNRFDTGSDWVDTNALTFGCWVKLDGYGNSNAGRLFENGKTLLRWDGGNTRMLFLSDGSTTGTSATGSVLLNRLTFICVTRDASGVTNFYVDGVLSGSADQATGTPTSGTNNIIFGNRNAGDRATEGVIIEPFAIVGTVETATQIAERYKLGAQQVQFKTDWGTNVSAANVAAGFLEDTDWEVNVGTWQVSTDTINDEKIKTIKNIAVGDISLDLRKYMTTTDAAYGTWEFDVMKSSSSTQVFVVFIAQAGAKLTDATQSGYYFAINATNQLVIGEVATGTPAAIYKTAADYVADDTKHRIKITRSNEGVFTLYMDGTACPASGETGTNPFTDTTYTTGGYIDLDLDADDIISLSDKSGNHSFIKYVGVI